MAKTAAKPKKHILKAARLRLMPLTMAMLALLLVAKLNDLYINSRQLNEILSVRTAQAEDAKESAPAEAAQDKKTAKKDDAHGSADAAEKPAEEPRTFGTGKMTVKQVEALKNKADVQPYSQVELDLLQNLTKRRDELELRNKDLDLRASVLEATEKRINDKITEMKDLQKELAVVVGQYKTQQNAEIKSLVKIYESMKPGDAAAIFDEMDMPILLDVIDNMSERKVAPILAGMSPKRARDVTQELAELRRGRQSIGTAAEKAAGGQ